MIKSTLVSKTNHLIIRFQRQGCRHNPIFNIVVILQKTRQKGAFIEKLGYLNPRFKERALVLNSKRLAYWIFCGVKLHITVKRHLYKFLC